MRNARRPLHMEDCNTLILLARKTGCDHWLDPMLHKIDFKHHLLFEGKSCHEILYSTSDTTPTEHIQKFLFYIRKKSAIVGLAFRAEVPIHSWLYDQIAQLKSSAQFRIEKIYKKLINTWLWNKSKPSLTLENKAFTVQVSINILSSVPTMITDNAANKKKNIIIRIKHHNLIIDSINCNCNQGFTIQ